MAASVAKHGPDAATGSSRHKDWLDTGRRQFAYLLRHGLKPDDRLLEFGCGNLRAGWHIANYLEAAHYTGVDISPAILVHAHHTIEDMKLESKRLDLRCIDRMKLPWVVDSYFDWIHAHSVVTHSPPTVVTEMIQEASRVLRPGGHFDFTFALKPSGCPAGIESGAEYGYSEDQLSTMLSRHSFTPSVLDDWPRLDGGQVKMRGTRQG